MTPRHIALASGAVLVLGACIYLFLEVRKPASALASTDRPVAVAHADEPAPEKAPDKPVPAPQAEPRRFTPTGIARTAMGGNKISDPNVTAAAPPPAPEVEDGRAAFKLEALMAEANKAYDKQDFDEARTFAQKVLAKQPANTRMLRIMVSAACIENDAAEAQKHYNVLPASDREAMKTRCSRYGITFADPPK